MLRILEEFSQRQSLLGSLNFTDAETRLAGFLSWLESQPETKRIIDDLKKHILVSDLLKDCGGLNSPKASSPDEIAAVGLFLMEKCREGVELFKLCHNYGIRPAYSTFSLQAYVDEAMERFIGPTVDYIQSHLEGLAESVTVNDLINQRLTELESSRFRQRYPDTAQYLEKIQNEMAKTEEEGIWCNIGNSCREMLKTFTSEIQQISPTRIPNEMKDANVKGILTLILKNATDYGRFEETLGKLVDSVWDHTQSILHRPTTTKSEASRIFIWAALVISELVTLLDSN